MHDSLNTGLTIDLTADEATALLIGAVSRMANANKSNDVVLRSAASRILAAIVAWSKENPQLFEELVCRMETEVLLDGEDGLTFSDLGDTN